MYENYPDKSKGDRLGAGHINRINDACRQVMGGYRGQYNSSSRGVPIGMPGHVEWVIEITRVVDASIGLYECLPRYSTGGNNWLTDTDDEAGPYELDISPTWKEPPADEEDTPSTAEPEPREELEVGDRLIAFWHLQREAFVAVAMGDGGFIEFVLRENIEDWKAKATVENWWGRDPGDDPDDEEPVNPGSENEPVSDPAHLMVYDTRNCFKRALKDAKGLAVWDGKRKKYIIVLCQSKAGIVHVTLTSTLGTGNGGATAEIAENGYYGTQNDTQHPYPEEDSDEPFRVYDPLEHFPGAIATAKGIAVLDVETDHYNLIECQSKAAWIKFKSTQDRPRSGSGCGIPDDSWEVDILDFGGSQQDTLDPRGESTDPFLVWDLIKDGRYQFPWAVFGGHGWALLNVKDGKYHVVNVQQMASHVTGTLPGVLAPFDSFDAVAAADGINEIASQTAKTMDNVFGFTGTSGALYKAVWNEDACRYHIYQVMCPEPE